MLGDAPIAASGQASTWGQQGSSFSYYLTGNTASYAATVSAATLLYGYVMYTLPGVIYCDPQSISILRHYGAPPSDLAYAIAISSKVQYNRQLVGTPASIGTTWLSAILQPGYLLNGQTSTYAVTYNISAGIQRVMRAGGTTYGVSPAHAVISFERILAGVPGSYSVALTELVAQLDFTMTAAPGSYKVAGVPGKLSAYRILTAQPAVYAASTSAATLTPGRQLSGLTARYNIAPAALAAAKDRVAQFAPASYVVVARMGTLSALRRLDPAPAQVRAQPFAVTGSYSRRLHGAPATYGVEGSSASMGVQRGGVVSDTIGISGASATLTVDRRLAAVPMLIEVLGSPATLTYSGQLSVGPDGPSSTTDVITTMQPTGDVNDQNVPAG